MMVGLWTVNVDVVVIMRLSTKPEGGFVGNKINRG